MVRTKLTTTRIGVLILRHDRHVYLLRFDAAHPLAAYHTLGRWLRDGVLSQCAFGVLLGTAAQLALSVREGEA